MEGVTVEAELGNTLTATLISGSEVTDADGKVVLRQTLYCRDIQILRYG